MPAAAEKYMAGNAQMVGGGGAANAACAIVKLGGDAQIVARIGDDLMGDVIINDLKSHSVDCSLVIKSEGARSSFSSVLIDANGERQIVNFRGSGLSDDVSKIENANPAAVLTDTRWSVGAIAAMKRAKELNIPSVLDAEAPVDPELLELATHVAFSRQGLESIAGELKTVIDIEFALSQLADKYTGWFAVTDGANGVYSLCAGEFRQHAAKPVDVVDTLGAGDVWHGAFTYWLARGYNEVDAVEFASTASALKCARPGGGRSCPDLSEVMHFMTGHSET